VPVLDRALAWVACELRELLPGGDHEIGIGEVVATGAEADDDKPLVFYRGAYTTIAE
jgi:3-hydroxy-9,10-secoandrosta-1,3,5(10)-triene-9,17-dione monooxygenase reductase component